MVTYIPCKFTGSLVYAEGITVHKVLGKTHKEDGPAIIHKNGKQEWWHKGKRHKEDGPAVTTEKGLSKEYWINGKKHRIDGPAVISGTHQEWWNKGVLHRTDGPAIEWNGGSKEWWLDGQKHRIDGPAVEQTNGVREHWFKGQKHREDGPAVYIVGNSFADSYYYLFNTRIPFFKYEYIMNEYKEALLKNSSVSLLKIVQKWYSKAVSSDTQVPRALRGYATASLSSLSDLIAGSGCICQ